MLPRKADRVRGRFNTLPSGLRPNSSGRARNGPPQSGMFVWPVARVEWIGGGRLEGACAAVCGGDAGEGCVTWCSLMEYPKGARYWFVAGIEGGVDQVRSRCCGLLIALNGCGLSVATSC